MRAQTAGEITLLAGPNYWTALRCKVANGSGTLIDLSSWVESWSIDHDIDQPTSQISLSFRRDSGAPLSLAPLRTDSTLNRLDDGVTYSPQLDAGRLVTFEVQCVAIGGAVDPLVWRELFRGYLDSIDAATPSVSVVGRDQGGILQDRWIETENYTYGYDTAMETVMQQILDDHIGAGAVTLYTPVSPSYPIHGSAGPGTGYPQDSEPVMDAIRALTQLNGWDVRYKWDDGTSTFRLTLYQPPRNNTTPHRSFTGSQYYDVTRLALDRTGVRNHIVINHKGTGGRKDTVVFDTPSITRFGRRFFHITEGDDSPIDTDAEATTKANAALSDLKDPKAEMEIEAQFFWPAELHDLYRFPANDVHFNSNQDWAVTNIRHQGTQSGSARTYLQVRGTPAGGYLSWRGSGDAGVGLPPIAIIELEEMVETAVAHDSAEQVRAEEEVRAGRAGNRYPEQAYFSAEIYDAPGENRLFSSALGKIAKVMTIPHNLFQPSDSADTDAYTHDTQHGLRVISGTRVFGAAVILPPGITITAVTLYGQRSDAVTATVNLKLYLENSPVDSGVILGDAVLAAGTADAGKASISDSGLSIVTIAGSSYALVAAVTGSAKLFYVTIAYTMPSYDKAL